MIKQREPKLLDLIAVTSSAPDSEISIGDVGTVVELLPPDGLEVEFLDRDGRTRCVATLNVNDVLVLNRERTRVA
jgi:catabolite regulation protein CreA